MFGYIRNLPSKLPWISGEGESLGTAWWVCLPQSEYKRLNQYERQQIEDVYFVLAIDVEVLPASVPIRVSAINRYRLFVNGVSVAFGPRKGDQYSHYYETVDIGPFLRAGKNILSAFVVSATSRATQIGPGKVMSCGSIVAGLETTALILEGTIGDVDISTGVADWKVRKDEAKHHHHFNMNDAHGSFELVDASKLPIGWKTDLTTSDEWSSAERLYRPGCNYYGQIRALPLIQRPFPQMEETPVEFSRQLKPASGEAFAFDRGGSAVIPANLHVSCVLDAGVHTTAFISTKWNGSGARITFTYSEALWLKGENGEYYKAIRDDAQGTVIGAYDRLITDGEGVYEPFWFRTFRFLRIDVETGENPITLEIPKLRRTSFPLEVKTSISSSHPDIKWLWDTSVRTLKNCMHETFEDCPYYEQYQYVMDSKLEMDYVYAISNELDYPATTIWDFHSSLRPDGMIACSYPSNETQIIPGFSLQFIWMLERYYHHTADEKMIAFYRPTMDAILSYFDRHIGDSGLCEGLGYWEFADWSKEWNACHGRPNAIEHGPSTLFNLMYAWSLQLAARLMLATGRTGMAREYEQRAGKIAQIVYDLCWVEERHMLSEAPGFNEFSQHAQVLGVLTGLLKDEKGKLALRHMLIDDDVIVCSLPWRYYLFRALERYDMYEEMRKRLDSFVDLRRFNFTTMPEWSFEGSRSDCHAWSATPLYELTATVLGVRPAEDGWKKILVQPRPLGYPDCQGHVTTPHGYVDVAWKVVEDAMTLKLTTPHETIVAMPDGRRYVLQAGSYVLNSTMSEASYGAPIAE